MKRFLVLAATAVICSIGCGPESRGADEPKAEAKPAAAAAPKVAAEAKKVLEDWYAAVVAAKTIQGTTQAAFSIKQNGAEVQADTEAYTFVAERPNKLAIKGKKAGSPTIVATGEKLYRYDAEKNIYTLGASPASFAEIEKSPLLVPFNQNQGISILGEALAGTALDKIIETYQAIDYVGAEDVGGKKRHHLRVDQDGVHFDWWFSADAPVQLVALSPNIAEIAAKNGRKLQPGIEMTLRVTFDDFLYGASVPADAFKIEPPADASLVKDFADPLALTLTGKPAPVFEGKNLKGETVKLADLAGKIVVVDFWATWCPPCVFGLPKLAEMTAKHKADGVVFLAVNLEEEPSLIKEFLAEKKLDINVLLDAGEIMKKYKVGPVPQTVFIDRKGVVQVVHIGIGELEEIPKQLEALVQGKELLGASDK